MVGGKRHNRVCRLGHNRDGVDRGPRYGVVGGKGWGWGLYSCVVVYGDRDDGKSYSLPPNRNNYDDPLIGTKITD